MSGAAGCYTIEVKNHADRRWTPKPRARRPSSRAADALGALADDRDFTLVQLATAWAAGHPAVSSVIIGPRTMDQLEGYLAADGVELSGEVLDRIDEIVPPGVTIGVT